MKINQALILCGGKGTRLGEQTKNIPKPMVPVGGRPVLDYIMDTLQESGITNFILLAGHLGEIIDTHYQENPRDGCNIEVVIEPKPLGTAGAVKFVSDKLDDNFVVAYGDIFTNFNLEPMLAVHKKYNPIGTLLVRPSDHPWDSHLIDKDEVGHVKEFIHTRQDGRFYKNMANAAFYVLNKNILGYIPADKASDFGADTFPEVLSVNGSLMTYVLPEEEFVKDMGTPNRFIAVEQYLQERSLAKKARLCQSKITTVLLDRDGVLNVDTGLIDSVDKLKMIEGSAEAVALLNKHGIRCFVITNQPVISRGMCSVEKLNEIHLYLAKEISKMGGKISDVYYCPHHPETHHNEGIIELRRACRCRKPAPGLIFQAQREHNFDLGATIMVGDRYTDIRAGDAAGVRTVLIGYDKKVNSTFQFSSLLEFAKFITA